MNIFGPGPAVSQAEKELGPLLLDDGCQVLSTFELNKIASLTYGEIVCDDIFELIEKIVSQPLDFSPVTIQKTLVVMKHVLIYGSEKCVNSGYGIGKFVEGLMNFNTVLAAQQKQGASAFFQRLQGGGVDRGGPVRDAAKAVHELLKNIHELQRIRNESASQNSLVPIGDDKVAFITDDVRYFILKKKIEQQAQIEIRSNLAKSEGGFGGGYMTKDGKSVVGAAHGIDEMIKMAQRDKKKFSDGGLSGPSPEDKILQELAAEARRQKEEAAREAAAAQNESNILGSFGGNPPSQPSGEVDLLDFGSGIQSTPAVASSSSTTGDLLGDFGGGGGSGSGGLLGLGGGGSTTQQAQQRQYGSLLDLDAWNGGGDGGNGLLSALASSASTPAASDPFAAMAVPHQPSMMASSLASHPNYAGSGMGGLSGMMNTLAIEQPNTTVPAMTPQQDRFAALDALASVSIPSKPTTILDAKMAENRLLSGGFSSSSNVLPASNGMGGGGSMSYDQQPLAPVPSSMPPPPPPNDGAGPSSSFSSMGISSMPSPPRIAEPMIIAPGTGHHVAAAYGDGANDDADNPWVMGGTTGSGLQPLGNAPSSAPPPPPQGGELGQ